MKPLFFIDYDNTIFSHRTWKVPEDALEALEQLQADDFRVILASGRAFRSSALPKEFLGRFVPDCLASSNGALVEAEGKLIWEKYFDPDLQRRLMDYILEKGYCMTTGFGGVWYTSSIEGWQRRASDYHKKLNVKSGAEFLELYHKRLPSFFLADSKEAIADVQDHFPELKLLYMGDELGGADIIPRENGKVMGARRILEYYDASWDDVIAIGDSMNDLELIRTAACGIAMGNAMGEVREAAAYVAKDIDQGGLADAIAYARHWAKHRDAQA